jgi:hypothetical protein
MRGGSNQRVEAKAHRDDHIVFKFCMAILGPASKDRFAVGMRRDRQAYFG